MATELGVAYLSLTVDTKDLARDTRRALGDIEGEGDRAGRSTGKRFGGGLMASAGVALKRTAVGVGVAAGAALTTSLVKGFGRLSAIEQAEAQLTGLGNSTERVARIMDNALASVRGTAFGLDEAATVSASAVAAGVKPGKELEATLRLVADAATIGGSSLGEMGQIFNKVASSNKVQGDVLNQLNERGIPIVQLLAKELGVTAAEVTELSSKGAIDFDTFRAAMQDGLGGAALSAGNTTQGAFKNMNAALGRFGAVLLKGVFPIAKRVLGGITKFLDDLGAKAEPVVTRISEALSRAFSPGAGGASAFAGYVNTIRTIWTGLFRVIGAAAAWLSTNVVPIIRSFAQWFTTTLIPAFQRTAAVVSTNLAPLFRQIGQTVRADILPALQQLVAKFREWQPGIQEFIGGIAAAVFKFWEFGSAFWGRVGPVLVRFLGFLIRNAVPAVIGFAEAFGRVLSAAREVFATLAPIVGTSIAYMIRAFNNLLAGAFYAFDKILAGAKKAFFWNPIMKKRIGDAQDSFEDFRTNTLTTLDGMADDAERAGFEISAALRSGLVAGMQEGAPAPVLPSAKGGKKSGPIGPPPSLNGESKKNGEDAGKSFLDGLGKAFDFGGGAGSGAEKAGKKAGQRVGDSVGEGMRERLTTQLESIREQYQQAVESFSSSVSGGLVGFGDQPTNEPPAPKPGAPEFVRNLRKRIAEVKGFTKNIRILARRGLPQNLLNEIIGAGLDGAPIAAALARSSDTDFNKVKSMGVRLERVSGKFGKTSARALYGAGVQSVNGLIAGLKSGEGALSAQMERMAKKMIRQFRKSLQIASPSKVFRADGVNVATGAALGVRDGTPQVEAAIADMTGARLTRPSTQSLVAASQSNGPQAPITVNVHNPLPERASESTQNVLRRQTWTAGWGVV